VKGRGCHASYEFDGNMPPRYSGDVKLRSITIKVAFIFFCWISSAFAENPSNILFFPLNAPPVAMTLSWLSEGIALSISEQLRGPGIKVVGRNERLQLVENLDLPPDAHLSHGSMIRVAQDAKADLIILGEFSGSERNLKVALRILDIKNLKLSGEITANGPMSALAQMENELAWLILSNTGLQKGVTREDFSRRTRKIPTVSYASFIQSFSASGRNNQIRLLQKAVEGFREFPEAHFQLGTLYFQLGDWSNALIHLSRGAGEESMEYEFMLGTCYVQQGKPVQAIQSLSVVLSSSRSLRVLNNIGVAYLRNGDIAQALDAFIEARNLARSDVTATMNLGIAWHLQGNDAAAATALEGVAKAHPKNGMLQFLLGLVLNRIGEGDKGAAAMTRAKDLGLNIDKLQLEDPKTWCLVHTALER
jgi:Flp pilus assembly protein TadD